MMADPLQLLASTADAQVPRLLLTPREAAAALSISERTLWSITAPRGALRLVRIGRSVRYDPHDLAAYIERQKAQAANALGADVN